MNKEEANQNDDKEMKMGKASFYNNYNYNMNELYDQFIGDTKPTLRNLFQTKVNRDDKIRLARNFVWGVGLLNKVIKLRTNYITKGFEIYCKDKEVEREFKNLNEEIDIEKYIKNSAWEHEVVGEWTSFINWNDNDIGNLTILDPQKIRAKSLFGQDLLFIEPPKEFLDIYNSSNKRAKKRLKNIIPKKYYDKWSKGQEVLIEEDSAERYFNQKAYHEKYSRSPIEPIFDDLALLSMYKESDYSVAYKIKKAILQVKVGNKDFNDGEPLDEEVIEQAEKMFKNPSEASEIFTQWFMDAEWIIPDSEVYYPEKYEPVIRSILEWSGLSVFLSEDSSYSGSGEKMEGFYTSVSSARDEIKKSIIDIYKKYAEKNDIRDENGDLLYPQVNFSDKHLQTKEELRKRVQFLYNKGMLTPESALETFGFNYNKEKDIKSEDGKIDEYLELINVPFEPSQDQSWGSYQRREQEKELENEQETEDNSGEGDSSDE